MEKIKITQDMMDGKEPFMKEMVEMLDPIPHDVCDEWAKELVRAVAVLDPDGVCYESPDKFMMEQFLILKHVSNIDTSDWDTQDGRKKLTDFMRKHKVALYDNYYNLSQVYDLYYEAVKAKHEHTNSLSYRFTKAFESVLGDGDIVKNLAESREITEKLIDMLGVFNKAKENETPLAGGVPMVMFGKK